MGNVTRVDSRGICRDTEGGGGKKKKKSKQERKTKDTKKQTQKQNRITQ